MVFFAVLTLLSCCGFDSISFVVVLALLAEFFCVDEVALLLVFCEETDSLGKIIADTTTETTKANKDSPTNCKFFLIGFFLNLLTMVITKPTTTQTSVTTKIIPNRIDI
jgi:hypothetical protein